MLKHFFSWKMKPPVVAAALGALTYCYSTPFLVPPTQIFVSTWLDLVTGFLGLKNYIKMEKAHGKAL